MAQIIDTRRHFWHNRHADHPVLAASLDTSCLGGWHPGDLDEEVWRVLQSEFVALSTVGPAAAAGEFVACVALSIQRHYDCVPTICGCVPGTAATPDEIFFAARDQFLAPVSLDLAASLVRDLASARLADGAAVRAAATRLHTMLRPVVLDQSSRAVMKAMIERDIPVFRVHQGERDLQSGHGHKQRRSFETLTSAISGMGAKYAANKFITLRLLDALLLPVGRFAAVANVHDAGQIAERVGFPVVVKPIAGGSGRGVAVHLTTPDDVERHARTIASPILIQSFLPGDDHRLLVVGGKFLAGAKRLPASVTGDGEHTIGELVQRLNQDPERGVGFDKLKVRIEVDADVERTLANRGRMLSDVPALGEVIRLRSTANISTGGTAIDVTPIIHPDNVRLAERAALALGLDVAGVDFLCPDASRSWREVGGGICEVNAVVGLRPHWLANPNQDVVGPIVNTIFPPGDNGRIPTAMVTGTNGKTTTCNMLDLILRKAGHTVGKATSNGVDVDGERLVTRDWAGVLGARVVLADPLVTAAALETARGGVRKWGTYLDWCDVAALLNVDVEQIGIDGINSLEDMLALKRKVTDCARKAVVLNADCPYASTLIADYPAERVIAFSLRADNAVVATTVARGGRAIVCRFGGDGGAIVVRAPTSEQELCRVADLPATLNGLAHYNLANAMAAAGLALGLDVPLETIRAGLRAFDNSVALSPGRLNFIAGYPFDVLFDYASNPPALTALMPTVSGLPVKGRRLCMLTAVGNRPDDQYQALAQAVAGKFDMYVPYEIARDRRGRAPGEIGDLIRNGLLAAGIAEEAIGVRADQAAALRLLRAAAGPGDLVVILGTDIEESLPLFRQVFGPTRDPQAP